jgi:hypothetical protein
MPNQTSDDRIARLKATRDQLAAALASDAPAHALAGLSREYPPDQRAEKGSNPSATAIRAT